MWPVVGHEWAVHLLSRAMQTAQVRHAYLFTGPPQVGKTTLARTFAQALLCQATEGPRPCGRCDACRRVVHDTHPDLRLLVPQGRGGQELLIDQIRDLIHEAALSPNLGRYKVFIVRQADRANVAAMNALLKTLEEPPRHVVILLTSPHPERLLPTIVSRCQVLPLRPLPLHLIAETLTARGAAPERAALLARLSAGRLGWALSALADETAWTARNEGLNDLVRLTEQSRLERLAYAAEMARKPAEMADKLALWGTWWRDLFLVQHGCADAVTHVDRRAELAIQARRFSGQQVRAFLADLMKVYAYLEHNANKQLALETLLLHLPRPSAGMST